MLVNVICKQCGRENQDLYRFCAGCGAELDSPADTEKAHPPEVAHVVSNQTGPAKIVADVEDLPGHGNGAANETDDEMRTRRDSLAHLAPVLAEAVAGARPSSARLCPTCGNVVPVEFGFCGQCGGRMDAKRISTERNAIQPVAASSHGAEGRLVLVRPDGTEGGVYSLHEGENIIGRGLGPLFDADGYLSPRHAELVLNAAGLVVRDAGSLNGVFVKLHDEEELFDGDVFRIGQELLRFDEIPGPVPLDDGTDVMGSPNPGYWGRLALIVGKDQDGSAFPLFGDAVILGRERGDILFPEDGYVSGQHARVALRDGRYWLADLNSSNGTFLRVRGERAVKSGSSILMGQQLFRVSY
jgi:pSer/pThr/pTyr-binding forkhead associated (FHA) protein